MRDTARKDRKRFRRAIEASQPKPGVGGTSRADSLAGEGYAGHHLTFGDGRQKSSLNRSDCHRTVKWASTLQRLDGVAGPHDALDDGRRVTPAGMMPR
jgi:hypothetical protein